jgi:ketosteroid isomerase-like protein
MPFNRSDLVKKMYEAFISGDREFVEQLLTNDFTFSSPVDVGLDRTGYFERCWPGAGKGGTFKFIRLIEHNDEVIVTYESQKADASKGCNTEILKFKGDKISNIEVYFGWNIRT